MRTVPRLAKRASASRGKPAFTRVRDNQKVILPKTRRLATERISRHFLRAKREMLAIGDA
jgi:hypothetical protein